jgi:hypothetical protein
MLITTPAPKRTLLELMEYECASMWADCLTVHEAHEYSGWSIEYINHFYNKFDTECEALCKANPFYLADVT